MGQRVYITGRAATVSDVQRALESKAQAALRMVDAQYVGITQPAGGELRVLASVMSDQLTAEQQRYLTSWEGGT